MEYGLKLQFPKCDIVIWFNRLLRLFICFGDNIYARAVAQQLLIWEADLKSPERAELNFHPNKTSSLFAINEEIGEMTLAILSRGITGDSKRGDPDHLSKKYQLVNAALKNILTLRESFLNTQTSCETR